MAAFLLEAKGSSDCGRSCVHTELAATQLYWVICNDDERITACLLKSAIEDTILNVL
jgi:hypothetical protein